MHRLRALLIRERTALMNQMHRLLAESGIRISASAAHLCRAVADILKANHERISEILRRVLAEMSKRLRSVSSSDL